MSDQACIRCGYPFAPGVSICSECGLERAQSARLGLTGARRDIFAIEWLLVTVAVAAAASAVVMVVKSLEYLGLSWRGFAGQDDVLGSVIALVTGLVEVLLGPLPGVVPLGVALTLVLAVRLSGERRWALVALAIGLLYLRNLLVLQPIRSAVPQWAFNWTELSSQVGFLLCMHLTAAALNLRIEPGLRFAWIALAARAFFVILLLSLWETSWIVDAGQGLLAYIDRGLWLAVELPVAWAAWRMALVVRRRSERAEAEREAARS